MTAPNPRPGAAPGLPNVTRRSLLCSAPALLAPTLLSGPALAAAQVAASDSLVLALFREWDELQAFWNDRTRSFTEPESDALFAHLSDIEERLLALPVTSLADLAAKLVVGTTFGDFAPDKAVVAECEALLAGVMA